MQNVSFGAGCMIVINTWLKALRLAEIAGIISNVGEISNPVHPYAVFSATWRFGLIWTRNYKEVAFYGNEL
jgi:hypothetical protein